MATPFEIVAQVIYPPKAGLPSIVVPLGRNAEYEVKGEWEWKFTQGTTASIPLPTDSGLKGFALEVDEASENSVFVRVNGLAPGADGRREVSPGGMTVDLNPVPTDGITALDIDYVAPAHVRIWLFG